MLRCPNKSFKSDPNQLKSDWQMLVDEVGTTRAYQLYAENDFDIPAPDVTKPGVENIFTENPELSKIGTQEQYSNYLDTIFPDSSTKDLYYHGSVRKNSAFDIFRGLNTGKGMGSKDGNIYFTKSLEIADRYVKSVRDLENTYDTSSHIKTVLLNDVKVKTKLYQGEIDYYVSDINDIHILGSKQDIDGFKGFIETISDRDSIQLKRKEIPSRLFAEEILTKYIGEDQDARDYVNVNEFFDKITNSEFTNPLYKTLANTLSRNKNLNIELVNDKGLIALANSNERYKELVNGAYAFHDIRNNTIYLNEDAIGRGSEQYFVNAVMHEYVHSLTSAVLQIPNEQLSSNEIEFKTKIERLYQLAKARAKNPNKHGYLDPSEFVSETLTSEKFRNELKESKGSILSRLLRSIGDFILEISGQKVSKNKSDLYQKTLKATLDFIESSSEFNVFAIGKDTEVDITPIKESLSNDYFKDKKYYSYNDLYYDIKKHRGFRIRKNNLVINNNKAVDANQVLANINNAHKSKGIFSNQSIVTTSKRPMGTVVKINNELILKTNQAEREFRAREEEGTTPLEQRESMSPMENRTDLDAKITILRDFLPNVEEIIEDSSRTVMGDNIAQVEENGRIIRINTNLLGKDSIGHEFGHVFIDLIGGLDNVLVRQGLKHLQGTTLYNRIHERYKDKPEDVRNKEVITQAIGEDFSRQFDEQKLPKWEQWLLRFFRKIKEVLGVESPAVRQLASRMLSTEPLTDTEMRGEVTEGIYEQRSGEEIRQKASESVTRKSDIYRHTGKAGSIRTLNQVIKKIEDEGKTPREALRMFSRSAFGPINQLFSRAQSYQKQLEKGEISEVNTKELIKMFQYSQGYREVLNDIRNKYIRDNGRYVPKTNQVRRFVSQLDQGISKIDYLEDFFKSQGEENMVKFLKPKIKRIEAEYRDFAIVEFNTHNSKNLKRLKKENKYDPALKEHVDKYVADHEGEISQKTEDLIRSEIRIAKGDTNWFMGFFETILDSDDSLISAYVKTVVEKDHMARQDKIEHLTQMVNLMRELENQIPNNLFTNPEDYYSFMLEKHPKGHENEGKSTGHYVSQYYSEFWNKREEALKKQNETIREAELDPDLTNTQREEKILQARQNYRNWRDENAPLRTKEWLKARDEYLIDLVNGKVEIDGVKVELKEHEYTEYFYYDRHIHLRKPSLSEMWPDNPLAVEAMDQWFYENSWEYRTIDRKWENPKYAELQRIRENNPNDARVKFYDFIVESGKMADKMVAPRDRLYTRLPGIIKDASEMTKSGQNPSTILDTMFKKTFAIVSDETERGSLVSKEVVDETGKPKYFLPIHYTAKLSSEKQSFDLATIYQARFESNSEYSHKSEVLSELEMLKYFIENRKIIKRDSQKNPVLDVLFKRRGKDKYKLEDFKDSNLMQQFDHWNKSIVYGMREVDEGLIPGTSIDKGKLANALNKYTALNLLGLNFIQGAANYLLGETMQVVEGFSGEHYTMSDYKEASKTYYSHLPSIMGDIGARLPKDKISLLLNRFDVINDYRHGKMSQSTRFRRLMNTNALFFNSHAGEHMMQTKVMLAMLHKLVPKDKQGNVIKRPTGVPMKSMIEAYSVDNKGNLILHKDVANFNKKEEASFGMRAKRILSRMHGEYSDLGRVAAQRYALGRMAYMFRKFVVQGYKRRWEKGYRDPSIQQDINKLKKELNELKEDKIKNKNKIIELENEIKNLNTKLHQPKYNELGDYFSEGNYITMGRYVNNLIKDMRGLQFTIMSENWNTLRPYEKANIKRFMGDVFFILTAIVLSGLFVAKGKDDDEDRWIWGFLSYQMLRWKAELLFFTPKIDESMSILRSPAASITVMENMIKLSSQVFDPFDVYESGPFKDRLKLEKTLTNMIPLYRQMYRMKNIDTQIPWFRQSLLTEKMFREEVEDQESNFEKFRDSYGL